MSTDLEHLARAVRARREELGLRQDQMRDRGGPSTTKMTEIEHAMPPPPTPGTLRKLDACLQWNSGSAARVLEGGRPEHLTPLTDLRGATDDELLTEIRKRMEARHGVEAAQESDAPSQAGKDQKNTEGLTESQAAEMARGSSVAGVEGAISSQPFDEDRQRQ